MELTIATDKQAVVLGNLSRSLELWEYLSDECLQVFMSTPVLYHDRIQEYCEGVRSQIDYMRSESVHLAHRSEQLHERAMCMHTATMKKIRNHPSGDSEERENAQKSVMFAEYDLSTIHKVLDESEMLLARSRELARGAKRASFSSTMRMEKRRRLWKAKTENWLDACQLEAEGKDKQAEEKIVRVQDIDEQYNDCFRSDYSYMTRWMDYRPGRSTCNRDSLGREAYENISLFTSSSTASNTDHYSPHDSDSVTHLCLRAFQSVHSTCAQYSRISSCLREERIGDASVLFHASYYDFTQLALHDISTLVFCIESKVMRLTTPNAGQVALLPECAHLPLLELLESFSTAISELQTLFEIMAFNVPRESQEVVKEVPRNGGHVSPSVGECMEGSCIKPLANPPIVHKLANPPTLHKPLPQAASVSVTKIANHSSIPLLERAFVQVSWFLSSPREREKKKKTQSQREGDTSHRLHVDRFVKQFSSELISMGSCGLLEVNHQHDQERLMVRDPATTKLNYSITF